MYIFLGRLQLPAVGNSGVRRLSHQFGDKAAVCCLSYIFFSFCQHNYLKRGCAWMLESLLLTDLEKENPQAGNWQISENQRLTGDNRMTLKKQNVKNLLSVVDICVGHSALVSCKQELGN